MKKAIGFIILMAFLLAAVYTPVDVKAAEPYDSMRLKWKAVLDGGSDLDTRDTDIAAKVSAISSAGQASWNSMNKSQSRTYLWSDFSDGATNSASVTGSYTRLRDMAYAYSTSGSALYNNPTLRTDLISAMDWLGTHWYTSAGSQYGNWWDWEIGSPLRIIDIMTLLYGNLTSTQRANYIAAIDNYGVDIASSAFDVYLGANRSDILMINLVCGIIEGSSTRLTNVRNKMSPLFDYVTTGDGFYTDGSFIQHTSVAYTGTYGQVLLNGMADLLYLLNGTAWDVTDPDRKNVFEWIGKSFEPIIYKGAAMDMARGRAVAREAQTDHYTGHTIIGSLAKFARSAAAPDAANYKSMIKYWVQQDTFSNVYTDNPLDAAVCIKNIMDDPGVSPRGELLKHYEMPMMDRSIHLASGFGFGVSRSSKRVQNFELMNGENGKGWTTGDGMTYLYNNDLGQFDGDFWCTVNPLRLPGTTVEVRSRYFNNYQNGDGEGLPSNNWSGGTTLENYGVSGMNLIPRNGSTTGSLNAYKSWFMFDDEVVCLGSKITASSGYRVESIVENRKLAGNNTLLVNGTARCAAAGQQENMTGVDWMHLSGNATGADIGYYFPGGAGISGLRQTRNGTWYDINQNTGVSTTTRTNTYMTLYYDHGTNPADASYSYVLLPDKTSSQVSSYAGNPDVAVISNTADVQSVKEFTLGMAGYNFFTNASVSSGDITSNKKASIMTRETPGGTYEIALSDPTMENTGTIAVEINKPGLSTISKDSQITVTQLSPTIKFTVNVNGAKGKAFNAKFQLRPAVSEAGENGTPLWTDNFDSGTAGQAPAGWTVTNAANTGALIDNTPGASDKSVKFTDTNAAGQSKMKKTFTSQNSLVVAQWSFMEPAYASKWPYFKLWGGSAEGVKLDTGDGCLNFVGSTGVQQKVMPLSANTWYTVKVVADIPNKQYDIYVDGVLKAVRASFATSAASLDSIEIMSGYSATSATIYVDDVSIKNGTVQ